MCIEYTSAVSLVNNGITGKIPSSLSFLKKMMWLGLSYNDFISDTTSGDLDFLAELSSLESLILDYNPNITGTLPDFVSDMSTLVELSVSNTGLYGTLPPTLSRLTNLEALYLDDCAFVGDLGVVMEMTNLSYVYLEDNAFTGTIDDDFFANSRNLVALDVSNCSLGGGYVPGHFFNFTFLEVLDMSENGIGGVLPADAMNASDGYLRYLLLHTNNITGSIPSGVGKLGSLVTLDLSQNHFTGSIPPEIGDISGLDVLFLGNNNFTGATAPEWIRNLTSLSELSLKGSSLTGPIPAFFGDMRRLRLLDLGENDLTGAIPLELDNLGELVVLILNSNELTGELGLGRLSKLGESFLFPTRSFRRSIPPPALTTHIPISATPLGLSSRLFRLLQKFYLSTATTSRATRTPCARTRSSISSRIARGIRCRTRPKSIAAAAPSVAATTTRRATTPIGSPIPRVYGRRTTTACSGISGTSASARIWIMTVHKYVSVRIYIFAMWWVGGGGGG
jgi:Leucine-rich repeat (LRR) protein